jgi:reverse gyrase
MPAEQGVLGTRCEICNGPLKASRVTNRFCCNACRQIAYRRRRAASAGGSLDESQLAILAALGVEPPVEPRVVPAPSREW